MSDVQLQSNLFEKVGYVNPSVLETQQPSTSWQPSGVFAGPRAATSINTEQKHQKTKANNWI